LGHDGSPSLHMDLLIPGIKKINIKKFIDGYLTSKTGPANISKLIVDKYKS
jgi:hypothetical protein